MHRSPIGLLAAASLASILVAPPSRADFVGYFFDLDVINVGGSDYIALDVHGQFDHPLDTVTSVFNARIATVDGEAFHHNDLNTLGGLHGTWDVHWTANIPELGLTPLNDSFVLIGGVPGSSNTTALDAAFDPSTAPFPPTDSGWFNAVPENLQGRVDPSTLRTHLGRFILATVQVGQIITYASNLTYDRGPGTEARYAWDGGIGSGPTYEIALVPAPAVAVVLLAGLLGARPLRRRGG